VFLRSLTIDNFRALEKIHLDFDRKINLIVGPNAVGKTTVLEAIRLTKALAAPRVQNESMQALFSLGASTPQNPQFLMLSALARDSKKNVTIRCSFDLETFELDLLEASLPRMTTEFTLAQTGAPMGSPAASIAFLSSPQGRQAIGFAEQALFETMGSIRSGGKKCIIGLVIEASSGRIHAEDPASGQFIAFLDRQLPPHRTVFSYFPADRALPFGEQPVQFGSADALTQMESYSSQPQLKYTRLKNAIFTAEIMGEDERTKLRNDFQTIFSGILKGRKLGDIGVNHLGLLSIKVEDTEAKRTFEIDGMSSGEKGLILTCLIIARSLEKGGIILFDEPELHLNPAVCRELLPFLAERYFEPQGLQAIICSHSPEILANGLDRDDCSVFHLISETAIPKVRRHEREQISEALRKLGTSESEGLLYKATIFVEGIEDVELLENGFPALLRPYKLKDLGGRNEVVKQVLLLQKAEQSGMDLPPRYFIFDRDRAPSSLTSSDRVKVLQWDRHCLENYLLDADAMTDILTDPEVVANPLAHQGEVSDLLRATAMLQLDEFVARQIYERQKFGGLGIKNDEIEGKTINEMADALFGGIESVQGQICALESDNWKRSFVSRCEVEREKMHSLWDAGQWEKDCDGKRAMTELHQRVGLRMALPKFKTRVMAQMARQKTRNWLLVEALLKTLVR